MIRKRLARPLLHLAGKDALEVLDRPAGDVMALLALQVASEFERDRRVHKNTPKGEKDPFGVGALIAVTNSMAEDI